MTAPEDIEKLRGLTLRPPKGPQFVEDDSQRDGRTECQYQEDGLGDDAGLGDATDDRDVRAVGRRSAWRLLKQGEQRASKRAQTTLRDVSVRRWDSAIG